MEIKPRSQTPDDALVNSLQRSQEAKDLRETKESARPERPERTVKSEDDSYQVELSPKAQKMREFREKLLKAAKDSPDVREDKVAHYKEQIKNGTYEVDSGKIADGMLREAVRERLAEIPE